jgi:hypothetical protein
MFSIRSRKGSGGVRFWPSPMTVVCVVDSASAGTQLSCRGFWGRGFDSGLLPSSSSYDDNTLAVVKVGAGLRVAALLHLS